jgi:rRNA-processing protein FCF1
MTEKAWSTGRRLSSLIKARIALLMFERPAILQNEIRTAMKSDEALIAFALRHEVSLDWLLRGDLRGLLRMTEWARRSGHECGLG